MEKGNNSLLNAVALLERASAQLKSEKREQVSRSGIALIKQTLLQALDKVRSVGIKDVYILGYLIDVIDCIERLLEDDGYLETDTEIKNIITNKTLACLDLLYIEAGKYYTDNHFDYNIRLESLLVRIVDHCVGNGYYFGEKVEKSVLGV